MFPPVDSSPRTRTLLRDFAPFAFALSVSPTPTPHRVRTPVPPASPRRSTPTQPSPQTPSRQHRQRRSHPSPLAAEIAREGRRTPPLPHTCHRRTTVDAAQRPFASANILSRGRQSSTSRQPSLPQPPPEPICTRAAPLGRPPATGPTQESPVHWRGTRTPTSARCLCSRPHGSPSVQTQDESR